MLSFVVGVGVVNAMLVSVRLRTREIGTLRALGLSRTRVLLLFVLEGAILGVVASGIGAAFGAMVAALVSALAIPVDSEAFRDIYLTGVLRLSVTPALVIRATLGITVVSGLACIWPALRAARLAPVAAFRTED